MEMLRNEEEKCNNTLKLTLLRKDFNRKLKIIQKIVNV